ncbi:hypothetical protein SELR_27140 [Selenomonas ruminantium subsp. lactilytica TAM6421]|uniref:Uncharacterized protein n=1 Tax=Selenomonas ruminantium subsp. lactilytica (strain NBRC 103574 / TAM6421) TaxID=927704 RepID=I0GUI5_SELRL|nr:hypothetical protein [Selenomonas ruminantium]BAL84422.1 hypothetical protein SELR_27140 [Selenomonas ruminantium subsp. lactilytica TAM6421]
MEPALFSPMVANIIIILAGTISFVALIGVAYCYSILISKRDSFTKLDKFEQELKSLQQDVQELKKYVAKLQLQEAAPIDRGVPATAVNTQKNKPADKTLPSEVWQKFVDDYNNLAKSMNVPKAAEACENFVRDHKLHLLVCVETEAQSGGSATPVYAPVDKVNLSNYWAWSVTGQPEDFVVVPNPFVEYTEKLHQESGMKETFASNYETGSFRQIQVKLPAHFRQHLGAWKIVQPGVIRLT